MKKILMTSVLLFALVTTFSFAQVVTPRTASPGASMSQTVGISKITVTYSRPSVKGREVWGALVPYGWNKQGFGFNEDSPWRAGANENTTIEFSHDAKVQGKPVPAGKYGLFFVINKDNSGEIILSKDNHSWGSFFYRAANDLLRAPITVRDHTMTEVLSYEFNNAGKNFVELDLNWEKKQFPVKVEFDVDNIVIANAAEELKTPFGFNYWQSYSTAANYALQNKVALDKAMIWIDQAIQLNKSFTTLQIKSGLLALNGNKPEADKAMTEATTVANELELNQYGYQLIAQEQKDKAIEIFVLTTQRYPESANAWDSLGEAYALKGDSKNAIKSFKKSLSLNPAANVKANSEKYLKQLGAM